MRPTGVTAAVVVDACVKTVRGRRARAREARRRRLAEEAAAAAAELAGVWRGLEAECGAEGVDPEAALRELGAALPRPPPADWAAAAEWRAGVLGRAGLSPAAAAVSFGEFVRMHRAAREMAEGGGPGGGGGGDVSIPLEVLQVRRNQGPPTSQSSAGRGVRGSRVRLIVRVCGQGGEGRVLGGRVRRPA